MYTFIPIGFTNSHQAPSDIPYTNGALISKHFGAGNLHKDSHECVCVRERLFQTKKELTFY